MIPEILTQPWETDTDFHQETDQRAERVESDITSKRSPGVLVVDDDVGVRTLLDIVLQREGFAVWLMADGYQAMNAYSRHRNDIDLVLIDVRMPGLDGPQTLAALQQMNPKLRCCFMTGDPGRYTEQDLLERGAERVLLKPFRLAEVAHLLHELMDSRMPQRF